MTSAAATGAAAGQASGSTGYGVLGKPHAAHGAIECADGRVSGICAKSQRCVVGQERRDHGGERRLLRCKPLGEVERPFMCRSCDPGRSDASAQAPIAARQRVRRESERGNAAHQAADRRRLEAAQVDLDLLVARLDQEYALTIVSRAGEKSGIDRYFGGKLSGYYVFVEALTPDGRVLPQSIKNSETGRTETVKVWGEQVSTAVWERIVADKQADGVVDDAIVVRKVRGAFAEAMVMLDENGKPMRRGRQITQW